MIYSESGIEFGLVIMGPTAEPLDKELFDLEKK